MEFSTFLGCGNLIGIVASGLVYLNRADFAATERNWREFIIPNPGWMLMTLGKMLVWWAVLAFWLVQGMPKSPWRAIVEDENGREVRRIIRTAATRR